MLLAPVLPPNAQPTKRTIAPGTKPTAQHLRRSDHGPPPIFLSFLVLLVAGFFLTGFPNSLFKIFFFKEKEEEREN